ncbi:MAG: phage holin family protein [Actinomycetota bacterium]
MAQIQDIPKLITEFVELAKEYLLQETVEPAKKLGHFAGYSLGAAAIWALALILLSVAGLRALIDVLPSGAYWEALGYIIFVVILVAFIALLVKLVPDRGVHDPEPATEETGGPS